MSSDSDGLLLTGLTVCFGDEPAVEALDLQVSEGEVMAVLGPSGCGKSTLLRAVGGLQPLDAGSVRWAGEDLTTVPAHRRGFGLMFQDHALFMHRSVAENIAFGLRMKGLPRRERSARVGEILELLDLTGYGDRNIGTLSGGEAQRVALGRALAPEPRLLMLDEPLASLDRDLSTRLAKELRTILTDVGMTALYVTHDQQEAFAVADTIAVMQSGAISAQGEPRALREDPGNESTARFLGLSNIYAVLSHSEHQGTVETVCGTIPAPDDPQSQPRVVIRPEAVSLQPGDAGRVRATTYQGEVTEVVLDLGDGVLLTALHEEPVETGSKWGFRVASGGSAWIR